MAKRKGRKGRKGKVPAHLVAYLFKSKSKKKKGRPVAKRKRSHARKSKGRKTTRRRTTRRRGRRHHGGGGSSFALMPPREDLKLIGACAAVGFVETKAKADPEFFLNKVPKPIDQLGYTGNLALLLRVVAHFSKNKWALLGARAAGNIAAYHIGRMGKPFSSGTQFFTVAGGFSDDDVAAAVEQMNLGALNAAGDSMPGVMEYDPSVVDYGG